MQNSESAAVPGIKADSVDYARLVVLLIEPVKEQQAEIEILRKQVSEIIELKDAVKML